MLNKHSIDQLVETTPCCHTLAYLMNFLFFFQKMNSRRYVLLSLLVVLIIALYVTTVVDKYNNWCKASKLIAPALTTIWSQIFKMGSWKKTAMQNCLLCY